jgi:putative transposase
MPRSARILLPGHIYHLTHRCHNGSFLLRFKATRDKYRLLLWEAVRKFDISILNYSLMSNHTHELLIVHKPARVSAFMHCLEGAFALDYNRIKSRRGAFWGERYHATLVEDGGYFWNCMRYIDLNIVRAGVVRHPIDWSWCGYQEIIEKRQRYCILDLKELLKLSGQAELNAFAAWYNTGLDQALKKGTERQAYWTESIAVGSESFVRRMASSSKKRKKYKFEKSSDGTWYVRDSEESYLVETSERRICYKKA